MLSSTSISLAETAEQGNPEAQFKLGLLYLDGLEGFKKDVDRAMAYLKKSAKQGYQPARECLGKRYFTLGECYLNGEGFNQDDEQAMTWFKKAAELGHVGAQVYLANMYCEWSGCHISPEKALQYGIEWYKEASKKNDSDALFKLAVHYAIGWGLTQNTKIAVAFLKKAAAAIDPDEETTVKIANSKEHFQELERFAKDLQSQTNRVIEKSFETKKQSPHKNTRKNAHYYWASRAMQYNKVNNNNEDKGDSKGNAEEKRISKEEIYHSYRTAAEGGHTLAQLQTGICLAIGYGVKKNTEEACHWFEEAASKNNISAIVNLGICYQEGWGIEKDEKQAVRLFEKASQLGFLRAKTHLGFCYLHGSGVKKDPEKAKLLLVEAAGDSKIGCSVAKTNLAVSYKRGYWSDSNKIEIEETKGSDLLKEAKDNYLPAAIHLISEATDEESGNRAIYQARLRAEELNSQDIFALLYFYKSIYTTKEDEKLGILIISAEYGSLKAKIIVASWIILNFDMHKERVKGLFDSQDDCLQLLKNHAHSSDVHPRALYALTNYMFLEFFRKEKLVVNETNYSPEALADFGYEQIAKKIYQPRETECYEVVGPLLLKAREKGFELNRWRETFVKIYLFIKKFKKKDEQYKNWLKKIKDDRKKVKPEDANHDQNLLSTEIQLAKITLSAKGKILESAEMPLNLEINIDAELQNVLLNGEIFIAPVKEARLVKSLNTKLTSPKLTPLENKYQSDDECQDDSEVEDETDDEEIEFRINDDPLMMGFDAYTFENIPEENQSNTSWTEVRDKQIKDNKKWALNEIKRGYEQFYLRKVRKAAAIFKNIHQEYLKEKKENAVNILTPHYLERVIIGIVRCYRNMNMSEEGETLLVEFLQEYPQSFSARYHLAYHYTESGLNQKSIELCEKLLSDCTSEKRIYMDILILLIRNYEAYENYEEVDRLQELLKEKFPEQLKIQLHIADNLRNRSIFNESIALYEKIRKTVSRKPCKLRTEILPMVMNGLIECYFQMKDYKKAMEIARTILSKVPNDKYCAFILMKCYLEYEQYDEDDRYKKALTVCETLLEQAKFDVDLLLMQASLYKKINQNVAGNLYESLKMNYKENRKVLMALIEFYVETEHTPDEIIELIKCFNKKSLHTKEVLLVLFKAYTYLSQPDQIIQVTNQLFTLYQYLPVDYLENLQLEKLEQLAAKCKSKNFKIASEILLALGKRYELLGEKEKALKQYEMCSEKFPKSSSVQLALIEFYFKEQQYKKVIDRSLGVMKLVPHNVDIYLNYLDAHRELGLPIRPVLEAGLNHFAGNKMVKQQIDRILATLDQPATQQKVKSTLPVIPWKEFTYIPPHIQEVKRPSIPVKTWKMLLTDEEVKLLQPIFQFGLEMRKKYGVLLFLKGGFLRDMLCNFADKSDIDVCCPSLIQDLLKQLNLESHPHIPGLIVLKDAISADFPVEIMCETIDNEVSDNEVSDNEANNSSQPMFFSENPEEWIKQHLPSWLEKNVTNHCDFTCNGLYLPLYINTISNTMEFYDPSNRGVRDIFSNYPIQTVMPCKKSFALDPQRILRFFSLLAKFVKNRRTVLLKEDLLTAIQQHLQKPLQLSSGKLHSRIVHGFKGKVSDFLMVLVEQNVFDFLFPSTHDFSLKNRDDDFQFLLYCVQEKEKYAPSNIFILSQYIYQVIIAVQIKISKNESTLVVKNRIENLISLYVRLFEFHDTMTARQTILRLIERKLVKMAFQFPPEFFLQICNDTPSNYKNRISCFDVQGRTFLESKSDSHVLKTELTSSLGLFGTNDNNSKGDEKPHLDSIPDKERLVLTPLTKKIKKVKSSENSLLFFNADPSDNKSQPNSNQPAAHPQV